MFRCGNQVMPIWQVTELLRTELLMGNTHVSLSLLRVESSCTRELVALHSTCRTVQHCVRNVLRALVD